MKNQLYLTGLCFLFLLISCICLFTCGNTVFRNEAWEIVDSSIISNIEDGIQGPVFQKGKRSLLFNCKLSYLIKISDPGQTVVSFFARDHPNASTAVGNVSGITFIKQPYPPTLAILDNFDGVEPIKRERLGHPFYIFDRINFKGVEGPFRVLFFPYQDSSNEYGFAICY